MTTKKELKDEIEILKRWVDEISDVQQQLLIKLGYKVHSMPIQKSQIDLIKIPIKKEIINE